MCLSERFVADMECYVLARKSSLRRASCSSTLTRPASLSIVLWVLKCFVYLRRLENRLALELKSNTAPSRCQIASHGWLS